MLGQGGGHIMLPVNMPGTMLTRRHPSDVIHQYNVVQAVVVHIGHTPSTEEQVYNSMNTATSITLDQAAEEQVYNSMNTATTITLREN